MSCFDRYFILTQIFSSLTNSQRSKSISWCLRSQYIDTLSLMHIQFALSCRIVYCRHSNIWRSSFVSTFLMHWSWFLLALRIHLLVSCCQRLWLLTLNTLHTACRVSFDVYFWMKWIWRGPRRLIIDTPQQELLRKAHRSSILLPLHQRQHLVVVAAHLLWRISWPQLCKCMMVCFVVALRGACLGSVSWDGWVVGKVVRVIVLCSWLILLLERWSLDGARELQIWKLLRFISLLQRYSRTWPTQTSHLSDVHGLCHWHPDHSIRHSCSLLKLSPWRR